MVILKDIWLYNKDNLKKYIEEEEIKLRLKSENKYFYYELITDTYPIEYIGLIDEDIFMFYWRYNQYEFSVGISLYNVLKKENIYFKKEKISINENEYEKTIKILSQEYIIESRRYILDTNCFIDYLNIIDNIINNGYKIMVPTVVIIELKGLSKRKEEIGIKATTALEFIKNNINNIVSSMGNIINNIELANNENFIFNDENSKYDIFILKTCENINNSNSKIKTCLITNDINLRISTKIRGLKSIKIHEVLNKLLI